MALSEVFFHPIYDTLSILSEEIFGYLNRRQSKSTNYEHYTFYLHLQLLKSPDSRQSSFCRNMRTTQRIYLPAEQN